MSSDNAKYFNSQAFQPIVSFIWSCADTLRDHYKKGEYPNIILPFVVIRRIDAVLEPSKAQVLETFNKFKDKGTEFLHPLLIDSQKGSGHCFYNTSPYTLKTLLDSPKHLKDNFESYLNAFSDNVKDIIDKFDFLPQVKKLDSKGILFTIVEKFTSPKINFSIHPTPNAPALSNLGMGYVFEELIRRFNEENNEEAGEHFTPREVIELMTHLLFLPIKDKFKKDSFSIYDNACGSGGMLTEAKLFITDEKGKIASKAPIELYGQEVNDKTYAICKADMMIKGENPDNIKFGSTLSNDGFSGKTFDFMLTNPPYGKDWGDDIKKICGGTDKKTNCTDLRFRDIGLSAKSDGQMMFLLNQLSKMKDPAHSPLGSRIASVHNGSSLFNSDSGMVAIRAHIIQNDLLEAIIALPTDMFYNTGIPTFIWIITNNKPAHKKGKVQLINATSERFYTKMKKSLGKKNKQMLESHIDAITDLFLSFADKKDDESCLVLDNDDFGYVKIVIEKPKSIDSLLANEKFNELKDKDKILAKLKELESNSVIALNTPPQTPRLRGGASFISPSLAEGDKGGGYNSADLSLQTSKANAAIHTDCHTERSEVSKKANIPTFHTREDFFDFLGIKLSKTEQNLLIDSDKNANTEKIPLKADIQSYYETEVKPFMPYSWINYDTKETGYEVLFNKYFYTYTPPRDLATIQAELTALESSVNSILSEILK